MKTQYEYVPVYGQPLHMRLPKRLTEDVKEYCRVNNLKLSTFLRSMIQKRLEVKVKRFKATNKLRGRKHVM